SAAITVVPYPPVFVSSSSIRLPSYHCFSAPAYFASLLSPPPPDLAMFYTIQVISASFLLRIGCRAFVFALPQPPSSIFLSTSNNVSVPLRRVDVGGVDGGNQW
ncbi:hypothetical protein PIB30_091808, partial [Stylosanthes scabra]|nr:hypothetical protein [Stylosanthes scabra]